MSGLYCFITFYTNRDKWYIFFIMKKMITVLISALILVPVFARPVSETRSEKVRLAVMQGPTGFSSAMMGESAEITVLPSPNEAVARFVKGEIDMAVVPANAALSMYNKGVDVKAVAIVGEGMLSLIGTDPDSPAVSVPGAGGTPDHMARLLYPQYTPDYSVTAPAQLAQMIIAGKTSLAILPQPFVTMVLSAAEDVRILDDVSKRWESLTGMENYPMSILIVSGKYASEHPESVIYAAEAYRKSVNEVVSDPGLAAKRIEELGIMASGTARDAIPYCALVYIDGNRAREEAGSYFDILLELDPGAVGSKGPDNGFWL